MEIRYRVKKWEFVVFSLLASLLSPAVWKAAGIVGLLCLVFGFGSNILIWMLGAVSGDSLLAGFLTVLGTCLTVGIVLAGVLALIFYRTNKDPVLGQWRIVLGEEMLAVENEHCTLFYSYGRVKGWKRWGSLLLVQVPEIVLIARRCFKTRDEEKEFLRQLKEKTEAARGRIELEFPVGESKPWFSFWFYTDPSHAAAVQRTAVDIVNQLKLNQKTEKMTRFIFAGVFWLIIGIDCFEECVNGEFFKAAFLAVFGGIVFWIMWIGLRSAGKKRGKKRMVKLSKGQIQKLVGKYRFFFYEDSFVLEEKEKGFCTLWPYGRVCRLVLTGNVIFFFVGEGRYTFLPASIFQSQEEMQAFLGFLEGKGITCTQMMEPPQ